MKRLAVYDRIDKEIEDMLAPYLRLDQKLPRSPQAFFVVLLTWLQSVPAKIHHRWHNRPDGT